MTHRTFSDARGVSWGVWDVHPRWADRRRGEERRKLSIDDPGVDPPVLEGRVRTERRQEGRHVVPRVQIGGGLAEGWLAFESTIERRRLSPIPPGWEQSSDAELAALCDRASPAPGVHHRLID